MDTTSEDKHGGRRKKQTRTILERAVALLRRHEVELSKGCARCERLIFDAAKQRVVGNEALLQE